MKSYDYDTNNETKCIIPDGVLEIADDTFTNATFKYVSLPHSLERIGDRAFYNNNKLRNVTIRCREVDSEYECKSELKYIGKEAFANCEPLEEFFIPKSVEIVGDFCFENCKSLSFVRIYSSSKALGKCLFFGSGLLGVEMSSNYYSRISYENLKGSTKLSCILINMLIEDLGYGDVYDQEKNLNYFFSNNLHKIKSLVNITNCGPTQKSTLDNSIFNIPSFWKEQILKLKYTALYFHCLGFNITNIKGDSDIPNSFKNPIDKDWRQFITSKQSINYVLSQNWNLSTGMGLILGYNDLRAIDLDGLRNIQEFEGYIDEERFIKLDTIVEGMLKHLGLPKDYPWVIKSGSKIGLHILFRCKDYPNSFDYSAAFTPNNNFTRRYQLSYFDVVELRWKDHLVAPFSLNKRGSQYVFYNKKYMSQFPEESPSYVELSDVDNLLDYLSGHIYIKNGTHTENGKITKFNYVISEKSISEYESLPHPCGPTLPVTDTISWLKSSSTPKALNNLGIKYLFGNNVDKNLNKARINLEKSKSKLSYFNLASLIAAGVFEGNKEEVDHYLNKLPDDFLPNYREQIIKNRNKMEDTEYYLFIDTETTGLPNDYNAPSSDVNNWPRLVQLSWILTDKKGNIDSEINYIIKPNGFVIPKLASNLHGITNEMANSEGVLIKDAMNFF